ncbi:MAG: hypothetical protein R8J84_08020 [Mariprofundales bacterium]
MRQQAVKRTGNKRLPAKVTWRARMSRWKQPLLGSMWMVGALLGGGVGLYALNGALSVRGWQVQCDDPVLQQAISNRLRGMAPLDFFHSSPGELVARLRKAEPDIATLEIERLLPHQLRLRAVIRQPLALWAADDGRVMLVDGSGLPYRLIGRGERLELPLLRCADASVVKRLVGLLHHVQQRHPARLAMISELIVAHGMVRVDMNRGAQWRFPLDNRVNSRADHILALLEKAPWHHGQWRIDARQEDRWFVRAGNSGREVI